MGNVDGTWTDRAELFSDLRRVVLKLGTRVVTVHDNALNLPLIDRLAGDVAKVREEGLHVAIVSSGAVSAGMGRLGLKTRPKRIQELQATAAVGQGLLMNAYKLAFRSHGIPVGQVLLTSEDLDNRRRYVNARNTLEVLFRFGAIPIINENDSVAVEEIQLSVGDNDRLSAMVSHLIDANLLITMTDVDGLYSDDPCRNKDAVLIPEVRELTPEMLDGAGKAGTEVSQGGMRTKLQAAESVTQGGRMMVIANGHKSRLTDIVGGKPVGTVFLANQCRLTDRKLWMANSRCRGAVVVDDGAVQAIESRGKSLLPSGIVDVVGEFAAGELISVENRERNQVARGLVRYGSNEIRKILGKKTFEIAEILKIDGASEVVHRDDLVVFT
jgi:glutamate 5-kinase